MGVCCHSVMSNSATPWIAPRQASLSITNSQSSPELMSIKLVIPSSHALRIYNHRVSFRRPSCWCSWTGTDDNPKGPLSHSKGESWGVSERSGKGPIREGRLMEGAWLRIRDESNPKCFQEPGRTPQWQGLTGNEKRQPSASSPRGMWHQGFWVCKWHWTPGFWVVS